MRARIVLTSFCLNLLVSQALLPQAQPKDRVARLLEELSNAPGASGFEIERTGARDYAVRTAGRRR